LQDDAALFFSFFIQKLTPISNIGQYVTCDLDIFFTDDFSLKSTQPSDIFNDFALTSYRVYKVYDKLDRSHHHVVNLLILIIKLSTIELVLKMNMIIINILNEG
jgi:hypothetical protein